MFLMPAAPTLQERPGLVRVVADSTAGLRAWDAQVDAMVAGRELRAFQTRADTLIAGPTHERLQQYYSGVPVFGGEIVRQLDGGVTMSVFGTLYQGIAVDVSPTLSRDEGKAAVEAVAGVALGPARQAELMVLPLDTGEYALVYRLQALANGDLRVYFVDAHDGHLVKDYSNLQTAEVGRGTGVLGDNKKISVDTFGGTFVASDDLRPPVIVTYDMRGDVQRTLDFLNGFVSIGVNDVASDSDNIWTDGASVDAHTYAGYTYDYFYKRFGRMGLDNQNIPIRSLVHPVRRQDLLLHPNEIVGLFFLNAAYFGGGVMVYGEGLPGQFTFGGQRHNYYSGALDIVAHELTHGVTDFSSSLIYENESGALNEAFSDIMGTSIEFFFQAPGTGPLRADYLMGEDVITPGGIRSMSNPAMHGSPNHYSQRFTGNGDNGGVHINSTIPSHAFYLAVEGGTNTTSGLGVQGVGGANREQIERTFYRAFVFLMPANATFSVARSATIQAARDLYGSGSSVEQAVAQAWTAVGVN
jgi:thermolysin